MPIAMVMHESGITMPVILCDSCGCAIEYQREGTVLFAAWKIGEKLHATKEVFGGCPVGAQPFFAHKHCVRWVERKYKHILGERPSSIEVGDFLAQIPNNCPPYRVDLLEAVYGEHPYVVGHEGCYVYVVWDFDEVIYVGKTTKSVRKRLNEHIKQKSPLGLWLEDNFHYLSDKHVHIYSCNETTIDSTERYYIQKFREYPSLLNIQ